jgi:DNA-directed RNA polymerase specialized sigma24 family protein
VHTQLNAEKIACVSPINLEPAPKAVVSLLKEIQALLAPHGVEAVTVETAFSEILLEIGSDSMSDRMEEFRAYMLGTVAWKLFARGNTPWICPQTRSGNEVPVDLLVNAYSLWQNAVHLAGSHGVDAAAAAEAFVRAAHITADRIAGEKRHRRIGEVRNAPKYLISAFRHLIPLIAKKQGPKQIEDWDLIERPANEDVSDRGACMEAMESGVLCWELLNTLSPYRRTITIARLIHGSSWKEIADSFNTSEKAARKAHSLGIRNAFGLCLRELQKMGCHRVIEVEKFLMMKSKKRRFRRKRER